jgi:hypothetical protein
MTFNGRMKVKKDLTIKYSNDLESYSKIAVVVFFLGWNIIEGAVFENEYPYTFVKLYPIPIWRMLLLAALIAGSLWDPFVGVMLAFTTFFYVMDMEVTMDKWK